MRLGKSMESNSNKPVMEGPANLQRGWETIGGKLVMTESKLIFTPHRMNVQKDAQSIFLSQIASVSECWTKFLNIIPIANNSLRVLTIGGEELRFVLSKRKQWAASINAIKNA